MQVVGRIEDEYVKESSKNSTTRIRAAKTKHKGEKNKNRNSKNNKNAAAAAAAAAAAEAAAAETAATAAAAAAAAAAVLASSIVASASDDEGDIEGNGKAGDLNQDRDQYFDQENIKTENETYPEIRTKNMKKD